MLHPHIFIILLAITASFQDCTEEVDQEITCTSLLDLQNKIVNFANVTIYPQRLDVRRRDRTKPTLQLTLTDEGNTISSSKLMQLNEIPKNIFGSSELVTISSDLFSNSPFKAIQLSYGEINNIEEGAFSNSNFLTEVSITHQKLTTVKYGVFNGLNLEMLALSGNQIRFLERNAFNDMLKLKSLHLDHNDLVEFQPEVLFNHGTTVENLWLQGNSITDFDRNLVRGLSNLRVLNLSHNKITRIFRYTFEYLTKLERLSLSHNLLRDFDGSIFPDNGFPTLSTLHISSNRLCFLTSTTLEKLRGLQQISIGGNPWQCPCYEILLDWIADHNILQVCDEAYSDGSRPVCVVIEEHRTTCWYGSTMLDSNKFNEINNLAPPVPTKCIL